MNKIQAELMYRFGRSFCLIVPYRTGSDPIEIGDIDSKVKVTMTENACLNDENKIAKNSNVNIFKIYPIIL